MDEGALFVAVQLGRKAAAAMLVTAGAWAKESEREAVLRNAQWGDFPGTLERTLWPIYNVKITKKLIFICL